jgi:adenylate cyclase
MGIVESFRENSLSAIYSLIAAVLLSIYGVAVCPYIDNLPNIIVLTVFGSAFLLHAMINTQITSRLINFSPPAARAKWMFYCELCFYILFGVLLAAYNFIEFGFPVESGVKIIVGATAIGLFASMDIALHKERREYHNSRDFQIVGVYQPTSKKMMLTLSFVMMLMSVILILVLYKDTDYLIREYASSPEVVKRAFFVDVLFLMAVFIVLALRVLSSYSVNMRQLFEEQIKVMAFVRKGDLSVSVPVATRDEFGLIAQETNLMIEGLREKERVTSTLGKVVSPIIADQLLNTDLDKLHEGMEINVAILICDIRGFTELSEKHDASSVVNFLNRYFEDIVGIIDRHDGVVDKFIGDAVLAVFGLGGLSDEKCEKSIESAVQAALEIDAVANKPGHIHGMDINVGVGVHAGRVIAGTIGPPQRFEFTVIGDTVNTASRIEGLSKRLSKPIIISDNVYHSLSRSFKEMFADQGELQVRGRSGKVHVYAGPVK